jgi:hypothetical protein
VAGVAQLGLVVSMYRYTGFGDLPSKMTMSQPAIFSSAPK